MGFEPQTPGFLGMHAYIGKQSDVSAIVTSSGREVENVGPLKEKIRLLPHLFITPIPPI